ncbi:response regulator [Candidatus Kaiserbacteria bacterium]|nr:response regulator [Candidatus Kaiserbacteria bacterium]
MARKILLIEDDQILSDVLEQKMKHEGFEITVERDGEAGLAAMKKEKFDLILLDIVMPKMNGYEVLEKKFNDPDLKTIPVIIISNSGQPVEIARTTALGALDHLVKAHLSPEEVLAKVRLYAEPGAGQSGSTCKGKKVMLIEDDTFLSDLLARRFAQEECEFMNADSGEKAMEILAKETPDIILLDLVLPGMSGFQILEKLKQDERLKKIPVVVLSNIAQQADIQKAIDLGALRHEVKAHLTPNEIVLMVGSLMK